MQFGFSDNRRLDIPIGDFDRWFMKYRFAGCHRSVYHFNPDMGFCTGSMAVIDHIFVDIDENPLEAVEILFNHFKQYRKIFITSGRNIHFLLDLSDLIPPKYAPATFRSFFGTLVIETDLNFDATSENLMQMRRVPGSVNLKNGRVATYFDPVRFEESDTPVVTGTKKIDIPVVRKVPNPLRRRRTAFGSESVDPHDLNLVLPGSYGHFDRIDLARKLKNSGVVKENALRYIKDWLPEEKYEHMLGEGIIDRIYSGKL